MFRLWNEASAHCSIRWRGAGSGVCLAHIVEEWESEIMLDRSNKEGQLANRQGVKGYRLTNRDNNKNRRMQTSREPRGLKPIRDSAWETLTLACSQNAGLEARLKERLPRSYEIYLEIISEMKSVMESLEKELGIEQLQLAFAEVSIDYISTPNPLPAK